MPGLHLNTKIYELEPQGLSSHIPHGLIYEGRCEDQFWKSLEQES